MKIELLIKNAACAAFMLLLLIGCGSAGEEEFFSKADRLYEEGLHEKAVVAIDEYLKKYPAGKYRDKALFLKGNILYYVLGKKSSAVKSFSILINQYPKGEMAFKAREILAAAFRDEIKDYKKAVFEFKWLITLQPNNPRAPEFQFEIARCRLLDGAIEEAILEFGVLLEKYPNSEYEEMAYDELGNAHLTLGRPDQALFIFKSLKKKYPKSPIIIWTEFKIANALEEMYRFSEAMEIYERIQDTYPNKEAVEIRINGVKKRKKNRLGKVKEVDYNYRPEKSGENVKNLKDKEDQNTKDKNGE